jgi:hypothetical protein
VSLRAWPFYFVRPFSCTGAGTREAFAVGSLLCAALVAMLTSEIEASRFPLSPRIVMLKRIRAKLRGEQSTTITADAGSKKKPRR